MHFWHHLDTALLGESIPGMGPEVLGDDAWSALFDPGPLVENPTIAMSVWAQPAQGFSMLDVDQRGAERPANPLGDIGAIEIP
jgi:hypothetical protein